MNTYIGTKLIIATTMNLLEYNDYRNWKLPDNENGLDEGYLVEYIDGGQANDSRHEGYISWSPKETFEKSYQASGDMSFGHALFLLKRGYKVARRGWNGKNMWLKQVDPFDIGCDTVEGSSLLPWIGMKTADDKFVPWLCSQTDMLSDDWCFYDNGSLLYINNSFQQLSN